jgi:hypothetical protein
VRQKVLAAAQSDAARYPAISQFLSEEADRRVGLDAAAIAVRIALLLTRSLHARRTDEVANLATDMLQHASESVTANGPGDIMVYSSRDAAAVLTRLAELLPAPLMQAE